MGKFASVLICAGAMLVSSQAHAVDYPLGTIPAGLTAYAANDPARTGSFIDKFTFSLGNGSLEDGAFRLGSALGNITFTSLKLYTSGGTEILPDSPVASTPGALSTIGASFSGLFIGDYYTIVSGNAPGAAGKAYTLTLDATGDPVPGPGAWLLAVGAFGALGYAARVKAKRPSRVLIAA